MSPGKNNPIFSFVRKWPKLTIFALLALAVIFFKGSICRTCVSYKLIRPRPSQWTAYPITASSGSRDKLIQQSLDETAELLSFTTQHCETNGNHLLNGGKTNCVGYADVCARKCMGKFAASKFSGISVQPYVAQLYLFGFNVHQWFDSAFWKDHDVVLICDPETRERILLDPTLYDYTGVGIVRERK